MSEPRDNDALLARLAELDLAAAEKAHARLMAAEEVSEIAELGRTYQRLSRCVRLTIALRAKLAREAAQDARRPAPPFFDPDDFVDDEEGYAIDARAAELQDAVGRMIYTQWGFGPKAREAHDRFDRELDDWIEAEGFTEADIDDQVVGAARLLGLREDIARVWRILKPAPATPDPRPRTDDRADAQPSVLPSPRRDSG